MQALPVTCFDVSGTTYTAPNAIEKGDVMAGFFDPKNARPTYPVDINKSAAIAGSDTSGNNHGFLRTP